MRHHSYAAAVVFFVALAITFAAALLARLHASHGDHDEALAGRRLNRWIIGLSAGTTGNSGFIVTGAVGLGYSGGLHWVLLPLSWMLGDFVYWYLFPDKLNRLAREANAITLSEMLTFDLSGTAAKLISALVSILLVTFLATYTSAQWLAGKKFLSGVFELSDFTALVVFSLTIVAYSSLGGFRGSVYTDVVQAFIRIAGTIIALVAVIWYALADTAAFSQNMSAAGPGFLNLVPQGTLITTVGFVLGYACAAVRFGLGQPQIITRYMAGASPAETKAAWWIYIGFVQFTWIAMTVFGLVLRGVMPGIGDTETGTSLFFQQNLGAIITGIIFADVFATIASTSNGILVAITQTLQRDLLSKIGAGSVVARSTMSLLTFALGIVTVVLSLILPGNVFSIAINSVSKIAAGVAGPIMIKALRWPHTARSLLSAIIVGIGAGFLWKAFGWDAFFNEAGVGLVCKLGHQLGCCTYDETDGSFDCSHSHVVFGLPPLVAHRFNGLSTSFKPVVHLTKPCFGQVRNARAGKPARRALVNRAALRRLGPGGLRSLAHDALTLSSDNHPVPAHCHLRTRNRSPRCMVEISRRGPAFEHRCYPGRTHQGGMSVVRLRTSI